MKIQEQQLKELPNKELNKLRRNYKNKKQNLKENLKKIMWDLVKLNLNFKMMKNLKLKYKG